MSPKPFQQVSIKFWKKLTEFSANWLTGWMPPANYE